MLFAKLFDTIVSVLAMIAVTVAFVGWLLVVAPIQHLVYAVLGAPARNALRNPAQSRFDSTADETEVAAGPEGSAGHAIGYAEKPVALTSALAAAVLWVASQFVA